MRQALIIVDVQNDFCPGGMLAVPRGDEIIPVLNRYISICSKKKIPVFASRDWHPSKTSHFKKYGGDWPKHCVNRTWGARFHPELKLPQNTVVISKGMDPDKNSYSAFQGTSPQGLPLSEILRRSKIEQVFIAGLATDYCVKATSLDALKKGLKVSLLTDAVAGVDIHPGDSMRAIEKMAKLGVKKISIKKFMMNKQVRGKNGGGYGKKGK